MFSLALKNAILLILIILIVHVLLKNMMLKRIESPPVIQSFINDENVDVEVETEKEDEHELYNYLYSSKKEVVQQQPCLNVEYEAATIGNFSKFADFASI